MCFGCYTLVCPSVNPALALLHSWQRIPWIHTLVDMDTATLFQYNSIRASEFSSRSRDKSVPVGGKVCVHEVLEHSVPEVLGCTPLLRINML